jgi:tight adherence protein C
MSPQLAALLTIFAVGLLAVGLALLLRHRDNPLWGRLRAMRQQESAVGQVSVLAEDGPRSSIEKVLTRLGTRKTSDDQEKKKKQDIEAKPSRDPRPKRTARLDLIQAGFRRPSAPALLNGVRVAAGLGVLAVGLLYSTIANPVLIGPTILLAGFGYSMPGIIIGRMASRRREDIRAHLPDALDLLLLCVEAGLGLNAALARVAEERASTGNDSIGEELLVLSKELQVGLPRRVAFRNLAERTGVDDVRALAAQLIQSERLGSSISAALRAQSSSLRVQRRLQAEEAANKTSIKLLFPLMFFIFPALFVVILVPAMMRFMESIKGLM